MTSFLLHLQSTASSLRYYLSPSSPSHSFIFGAAPPCALLLQGTLYFFRATIPRQQTVPLSRRHLFDLPHSPRIDYLSPFNFVTPPSSNRCYFAGACRNCSLHSRKRPLVLPLPAGVALPPPNRFNLWGKSCHLDSYFTKQITLEQQHYFGEISFSIGSAGCIDVGQYSSSSILPY